MTVFLLLLCASLCLLWSAVSNAALRLDAREAREAAERRAQEADRLRAERDHAHACYLDAELRAVQLERRLNWLRCGEAARN